MALLLMSILFSACSDDSDLAGVEGDELLVGGVKSRAVGDIETGTAIRLFLVSATDNVEGSVVKTDATIWRSTTRVKKDVQYYVYGFMPVDNVQSASVAPLQTGLDKGAKLTLNGIDAVTQSDICVIVGVQDLQNKTDAFDVKMGSFSYLGKDRGMNYTNLLLDHLQSSVHFELYIDNNYSLLRTIKVKTAEILAPVGSRYNMTVTLSANSANLNPISTLSYTPTSGETDVEVFNDDEGRALSTLTPLTFDVNYLTPMRTQLQLKTTYDVYDSKGNFIHTRTSINSLGTAIPELQRGERTTLTLTVKPTYLYVLSDPDLNDPTIIIGN